MPHTTPMIRVLLVDDHPVVRAGYKRLLEADASIEVVAEASDADSAYLAYVVYQPDVTVLDLSMPGVSGLSLLQKILLRDEHAKVLICSMYDAPMVKRKALEAGAKSFVSKNVAPDNLLLAIHAVNLGEAPNDAQADAQSHDPELQKELDRIASLTLRELELFRLLALGKTVGYCAMKKRFTTDKPKSEKNSKSTPWQAWCIWLNGTKSLTPT